MSLVLDAVSADAPMFLIQSVIERSPTSCFRILVAKTAERNVSVVVTPAPAANPRVITKCLRNR